jgi:decaprenylphospho-beta-D-ribofuranose 2-oxidase
MVMPIERINDYINAVQDYLSYNPIAVTLASAKLFRGRRELLRFTGDGICFALNFPRTQASSTFLNFLDKLVISVGGFPNIIKDSRLPRSVVDACYPEADRFRGQLHTFDPKRRFRSELSERLGL